MECPACSKPNRSKALYCKWCGENVMPETNDPLSALIGMESIKKELNELIRTCENISLRAKKTGVRVRLGMDMVITGNTGTGKTELIKVLQNLLFSTGIIKKSNAVIVDAVDFDEFLRKTDKTDNWSENTNKAKGGLLVIENAQKLVPQTSANDINKLDKLFKCMNDEWDNDPIVILSGLSGLKAFMIANADIANRFEYHFDLTDYDAKELTGICLKKLHDNYDGLTLNEDATAKLERIFKHEFRNKKGDFGNGHLAAKKASEIFANVIKRDHNAQNAGPKDITGVEFRSKSYDEIMQELDSFVGIDEIKQSIKKIISRLDTGEMMHGDKAKREIRDHFLFLGNPGTGKTTVARIFADILNALDVLPTGQLVEVSRKDLVAGYVGHTAIAVEEAVNRAMGGILFIDEAYSIIENENDAFGKEAINTLLKLIEDNRGKLVAIAAGYTKEMADFLAANSGMKSRFNETINFRDYTPNELTEIFRRLVKKEKMNLSEEAEKNIENFFKRIYISRDKKSFGNAREVRNVFSKALKNHALRVQQLRGNANITQETLFTLTRADIEGEENLKEKDLDTILTELDQFIGMDSVKSEIRKLATKLMMDKKMQEKGFAEAELTNVHIVLTGNPGTGKTTIANKLGEIFKAIGLLPSNRVVVKEPKDILSSIVNDSAKRMDKACDEAMGATLLIDEAYNLAKVDSVGNVDETGRQAVEALMTRMSNDAGKFVVIVAGYKNEVDRFIQKANPGLDRRFTTRLHIEDYTASQLVDIYKLNAKKSKLILTQEAEERLHKLVNRMVDTKKANFGNAGEMIKVLTETKTRKANRLAEMIKQGIDITKEIYQTIEAGDIPYDEPKALVKDDYLKDLNQLIGLENVKNEVRQVAGYIEVERAKAARLGKKFQGLADHYLFVGNPGTGKTTVARIMADILYALDVLPTNKLVETARDGLVDMFQGHTAQKTKEVFQSAMGGVLFIDEAYALKQSDGDSFGQEAIDTLLKLMEDNRGKIICIAAGYPYEIEQWLNTNSGLKHRFTKTIDFDDYNGNELSQIFLMKAQKDQLILTPEAEKIMRNYFNDLYEKRDENFANARQVNKYFAAVKTNQSIRIQKIMNQPDFDADNFKLLVAEDMLL
ncbi:MAG: AAA family ATPase [Proteiniphilum sp.]|nr:AAA family ATPase [Proteiniphilum sp.]MDD3908483.1 AAA family ATPase [Proteiniphilum sp.]MDD4415972.1 AAA family ATPase [Proteiniphilum sp.]